MTNLMFQRLSGISMLPDFRTALTELVARDWSSESPAAQERGSLYTAFTSAFELLGGGEQQRLEPFLLAWYTLRAAVLRLDHLQDGDTDDVTEFATTASPAQQYNLILASYALATTILDDLDHQSIPLARVHRLRQLWGHSLLEAASGQHRDLAAQWPCSSPQQVLEFYEDAVRAKAGSIYRIGFGGTAVLATDCQHMVDVFCRLGEAYGVLLQLNDDLLDAATESKPALTLSQAYRTARQMSGLELPPHAVHAYAQQIHQTYFEYVRGLVMTLPPAIQRVVLPLFHQAFSSGDESFSST